MKKLWGGRFGKSIDSIAAQYNNSLPFDWRLVEVDVRGSIAWAQALLRAKVINSDEASQLISGLTQVMAEAVSGQFEQLPSDEDVHTAVERRMTELIGATAGKLHTGRSRNDQVATDFIMWIMEAIDQVGSLCVDVQRALVDRAEMDFDLILPGYTHLQRAQPVLLSHWWLAQFWAVQRDLDRFTQLRERVSVLPLGSGALAGTALPIDRMRLANELGFAQVSPNSMDAVSNRDFAAEFLFCASLLAIHLSRLSEALIITSSAEFGFFELSDAYSTGSSLMPQKKNPDMLELTRGKAGTLIGKLTGLLAVLKGLPSSYDKDLQEDKQPVFECFDLLELMLPVMAGVLNTITVNPEKMAAALDPAMLATDLADELVEKGVPFREAHHAVGAAVRRGLELGVGLHQLALEEYQKISPAFDKEIYRVFDFKRSIARRNSIGGTSPEAVMNQLAQAIALLAGNSKAKKISSSD